MRKVLITAMICITLVVCTFMVACTMAPAPKATPTSTPTPTATPTPDPYFSEGNGTKSDPFMIYTAEELFKMAELVNNSETDEKGKLYAKSAYKLGADIMLNDETFEFMPDTGLVKVTDGTNEGYLDTYTGEITSWTPIGKYAAVPYEITDSNSFNLAKQKYGTLYYYSGSYYSSEYSYNSSYSQYYYKATFKGSFDGDGHTISGILINTNEDYQGLFGYVENGKISNVTIENSYIRGGSNVGGIVGYCEYGAKISDCVNSGDVSGSDDEGDGCVGGIAGFCIGTTTIRNCVNSGAVSGGGAVGGILGDSYDTITITNCENSGDVSGSGNYVGGIAGLCSGTTAISNCENSGTVSGSYWVGGIVGMCSGTISDCENSGAVSGDSGIGGIAGRCDDDGTISNCVNSGTVSGSGNVGAIAGLCYGTEATKTTIEKCYSVGAVTVNGTLKDIAIGAIDATNNIVRSRQVYILDTSAADDITNGGTLLTDEQMREQSSFAGFDFDTVWTMDGDTSYPYPELQALVK